VQVIEIEKRITYADQMGQSQLIILEISGVDFHLYLWCQKSAKTANVWFSNQGENNIILTIKVSLLFTQICAIHICKFFLSNISKYETKLILARGME